jgi:hypothetical protein
MKNILSICVDFDGTVVYHKYPKVGEDVPYAVKVLNRLVAKGHKIILFTMRSGNYLTEAVLWYHEKRISLYGINTNPDQKKWTASPKAYGNVYIDDAALGAPLIYPKDGSRPYVDWKGVEKLLEKRMII